MEEIDPNDITSGKVWQTENEVESTLATGPSPTSPNANILSYHPSDTSTISSFTSPTDLTHAHVAATTTVQTTTSLQAPTPSMIETFGESIETASKLDPNLVARATLTSFDLQLLPTPYQANITEPLKHGESLKDAYVSYLICTTDMEQGTQYQVRRRFTDFVWLHQQLTAENPACIVCPLPDKHRMEYITGDRFSVEFLEKRRSSLNRFINRILRHPILQKSPDLHSFLTAANWNLDQMRPPKKDGMFDNLSEAILNAFSKLKQPDPKFLEMKEQVTRLEDHLQLLEKFYTKMIKKHLELEHEYAELGAGITSLGVLEAHLTSEMTEVGAHLYAFAKNFHDRAHHEEVHLCAQLRDYLNYCNTVKYALKLRDHRQLDYEILVETCLQHHQEKQKLELKESPPYTLSGFLKGKYDEITGVDQERTRAERIQKLDLKILQLQSEIEEAKLHYTQFSENVAKEIDYFQATRSIDFKDIFLEYTDHQIHFFQKGLKQWESVLPILDQIHMED